MQQRKTSQRIIISLIFAFLISALSQNPLISSAADNAADSKAVATIGQQNAFKTAKRLLKTMSFSRQALYDQLTSETGNGYLDEEATYAIEKLEADDLVDWNEQAVKTAKIYLAVMPLTKDALIEMLSNQYGAGFTKEQAEYAAKVVLEYN